MTRNFRVKIRNSNFNSIFSALNFSFILIRRLQKILKVNKFVFSHQSEGRVREVVFFHNSVVNSTFPSPILSLMATQGVKPKLPSKFSRFKLGPSSPVPRVPHVSSKFQSRKSHAQRVWHYDMLFISEKIFLLY